MEVFLESQSSLGFAADEVPKDADELPVCPQDAKDTKVYRIEIKPGFKVGWWVPLLDKDG